MHTRWKEEEEVVAMMMMMELFRRRVGERENMPFPPHAHCFVQVWRKRDNDDDDDYRRAEGGGRDRLLT